MGTLLPSANEKDNEKLANGIKCLREIKETQKGDIAGECDHFLNLSVYFCFGDSDWWWLGEQVFLHCINISRNYHGDGLRRLAIAQYLLGKYLFDNKREIEPAIETLKKARVVSNGHSWTASKYLHCTQKTVFVESCLVLHKALLAQAKIVEKYDLEAAVGLCAKARRRAYDACDHEGEATALMQQGDCEMCAEKTSHAAESYYKVLLMHIKANRIKETCEARVRLIQAYLKLGNWKESYHHLQQLLQCAESYNMPYYIGQSYRYMGEYYLNHGNPDQATPLLIKALNAFHEIGDISNREQTKNFAAVSAGQELMPKYINFILKCGKAGEKGSNYLEKLIRWKDTRDVAWSEAYQDSRSEISIFVEERDPSHVKIVDSYISNTKAAASDQHLDAVTDEEASPGILLSNLEVQTVHTEPNLLLTDNKQEDEGSDNDVDLNYDGSRRLTVPFRPISM
ncbi:tetratricopeptide repeat protein 29 [Holotrichia oblita]|uniref:Tetratricopeptide repeat protein 29 n=1 Tax=Holotrichia oblita TaxID=644536 RepID=A0ACB9T707_HOLOL|nr:tetratricopeptide repeat protein 29 [Holotrichia oblita]